jgi:RimJ/RimL family protein N-acetyltransferase
MVRLMLEEAFGHREAEQVSLVVFPENRPALRCYNRIGFRHAGFQVKYFQTTGKQHRMIRMTLRKSDYGSLDLPSELQDLSTD